MQKQKILKILFILTLSVIMFTNFTYATDIDPTALNDNYSNSITTNSINNSINSTNNSINNSVNSTNNSTTSTLKPVTTNPSSVTSITSDNSLPEANLGFTNILNIVLIVIGVLLILLAIAILVRLKK